MPWGALVRELAGAYLQPHLLSERIPISDDTRTVSVPSEALQGLPDGPTIISRGAAPGYKGQAYLG